MINSIFILDKSKTVVDVLSNNGDFPQSPFFDDKYVQDLATGAETFEFTTVSNDRTSKYAVAGNYVAFKFKNKIKVFQIMQTKEEHEKALYKSCYCEIAGLELINNVIREREIPSANVRQFFEIALADTDWSLGIVDAAIVLSSNIKIERATNVYSLIQNNLSTFDIEIEYRFEMTNNKVSGMYIDVYKNRGIDSGFRFEYGQNVSGVSKQVDMSELFTAMIGVGKDNIDFKSVQWGADKPAIKPLNQDFIVDVEAHKIWNNNGSYLMGIYQSQADSPHELLALTWNELQKKKQPKITYDIEVNMLQGHSDEINIGDTVKVIDNDYIPALHLTARIGILELSFTDHRQNRCILTNFKEAKSSILSLDTIQSIINGKFPIGAEQIQDGAITEGKIDTQYLHTIKTDVLVAAKVEAEELIASKAEISDLNATNAKIENLIAKDAEIENAVISNLKATTAEIDSLRSKDALIENLVTTKANIADLNAANANINNLEATKANITDLNATNANINALKADVAEIDTLLAGNITGENIQGGSITSNELATGTITAGSGVIADGAIGNAQISSLDAAKINAGTVDTSKVTVAGPNSNLKLSGNRLQVFNGVGSKQVERVSLGDVKGDGSQYGLLVRGKDGKTIIMDENGVTNAGITDGSITNDKINPDANIDGAKININSVITRINEDGTEVIKGTKVEIDGTNLSTKLSTITTTQTTQGNKISEHSSKIAANESQINLKVDSQTYKSDKEEIETQLNKNTADIALNKEQIALKVEQTDIDKAKSEVEGKIDTKVNAAKAEIKVTTDKISQNVSNLTTTVNNKADGTTVSTLSNKVGSLETSLDGISGQVSSLETTTTTISSTATNALNKANTAQDTATNAQNIANNAQDSADNAQVLATDAQIIANNAQGLANNAQTTANKAQTAANNAQNTANENKDNITDLQGEVTTVKSDVATLDVNLQGITQRVSSTESTTKTLTTKVTTAQSTADTASTNASKAQSTANTAITNAQTAQNTANTAKDNASKAQTTADSKAKVFTSTPTTPYKVGDLWVAGPSGDVMKCKTARSSGNYASSDWEKASKYTDDTKANAVDGKVTTLQTEYNSTKNKVSEIVTNLDSITQRVSSTESTTTTLTTKVNTAQSTADTAKNNASAAQTAANNAQSTANSKAKVFTSTPTVPYRVGDLWTAGPSGDVMRCKTARTSGSYTSSDWEKASKYTDDTKANAVDSKVNTLQTEYNSTKSKVAEIVTNLDSITQRVSSTETTTTTLTNKVNTAQSTADTAKSNAATAQSTANTAKNNAATAQTAANNAQFTADSKAKVFTSTPTIPYKVGDLWVQGSSGDVMRCKTARTSGSYTSSDWEKASKYTDDTKANAAQTAANNAQSTANTANTQAQTNKTELSKTNTKVSSIETNLSSITSRVSNVESKQTTVDGKVSSLETRVTSAESKITESAITNTVKKNFYTKSETDSAITSKGYQTSSQVQQTVNGLQVKVQESGGYNLIYNGDFRRNDASWTVNNRANLAFSQSGLSCPNGRGIKLSGALNTTTSISQNVSNVGQTSESITVSYYTYVSSSGEDGTTNAYRAGELSLGYTDGTNTWHNLGNASKFDTWEKRTITVKPTKRVNSIRIGLYNRDTTRTVYYSAVMIEKGTLANEWTPNPNEVYDGVTTIDKNGITVSNTSSSTYTQIDSESFRVEDNKGGTVAEFSKDSIIPNLTAGIISANEVHAANIPTKAPKDTNIKYIYVNGSTGNDNNAGTSSSPLKTVQKALDMLSDVQHQSVTIYVYNSVPGFELKGTTGIGKITISLQDSAIVNGRVLIGGVTNRVSILSEAGTRKPTFKAGIAVYACVNVEIYALTFRGECSEGGNIYIRDTNYCCVNACDLGGLSTTISCAIKVQSSLLWLHGCIGSNITDVVGQYSFSHVMMSRGGTSNVPDYKNGLLVNYDGPGRIQNWTGGNFLKTASSGWNPAYTPTSKTQTWSFNKIWSDETLNGWSDRQELIQGYASTWDTGRWTGYMQFTDSMAAIRSAISGGTNFSGRLYVQRRTSSGNSTGSKLCLYASDGTLITNSTSINRGQGVWVSLSSAVISKIASGAITYFYLKADSNNAATFFKCEANPKIEITYTK